MLRFGCKFARLGSAPLQSAASRSQLLGSSLLSTRRLSASSVVAHVLRPQTLRFASTQPQPPKDSGVKSSSNGILHHEERLKETKVPTLTWNEFFQLRKRRRVVGLGASVFTALGSSVMAFQYFANLVIDFNQMFMGIEMQWIYLGGIVISGCLGWLAGPLLGNQLFNLMISSKGPVFNQMDNVFLRHVARNRPNPTKHNVNTNPLPDYYGEKIGSLHDYRQWLREGRLFAKKAEKFF